MIVLVTEMNLTQAAAVHSAAWKESHRAFCTPEFVELHTPERQMKYLQSKMDGGTKLFLLLEDEPVGIVSVTDSLIEDLYVLPEKQNRGVRNETAGIRGQSMHGCADAVDPRKQYKSRTALSSDGLSKNRAEAFRAERIGRN